MSSLSLSKGVGRTVIPGGFLDHGRTALREPSPPARRIEVSVFLRHPSDFAAVDAFARAHELRMKEADVLRRRMTLDGTVRQFAEAFRTGFVRTRSGQGMCRALARAATLPKPLADRILFVHRLKTYPPATPSKASLASGRIQIPGGAPSLAHVSESRPCFPSHQIDVTFLMRNLADAKAVSAFLLNRDLSVFMLPCRQLEVRAHGTLQEFGRLFDTEFFQYKARGAVCRDIRKRATLPAAIAGRVLFVVGLKTFPPAPRVAATTLAPGGHSPLAGTTVADSPESAGVVLEDRLIDFEIRGPLQAVLFAGRLQDRVVRSSVTGKLIFEQRIRDTQTGLPATVTSIGRGNFSNNQVKIDYRLDGLGTVGPPRAFRSAAKNNGRSVQFQFPPLNAPASLVAGSESRFCEVISDADTYARVGFTSIVAATSAGTARTTLSTFSPLHS